MCFQYHTYIKMKHIILKTNVTGALSSLSEISSYFTVCYMAVVLDLAALMQHAQASGYLVNLFCEQTFSNSKMIVCTSQNTTDVK